MKTVINRKTYNTDTALRIGEVYEGQFGDPAGYEERLYKTRRGEYFLYGIGGQSSKYPAETIELITRKEAESWEQTHLTSF